MNSGGVLGGGRFPSGGMICGYEGWARFFLCERNTLVIGGGSSLVIGGVTLVVCRGFLRVGMGVCTLVIGGLITVVGGSSGCCTFAIGGCGGGCIGAVGRWGCDTRCLISAWFLSSAGDDFSWGSAAWNISANFLSVSI
eukprot:15301224-Ditylum_brightwellii.AAC.1